jgi:UDP-glucuronate 4-epimerase
VRIVVTGAAGFIGSALSKRLAVLGHQVLCFDNYSDYYSVSLKRKRILELLTPIGVEVQDVDLIDRNQLSKIIDEFAPDTVMHLAAQAGVRLPLIQTEKYVNSNLVGFSNLLEIIIERNIPNFIYASSSSVYGDQAAIPYSEKEMNLHPNSFYGATKLANEILTPTLVSNSNTRARGVRFFTVYGPWGRPDMAYFRMIANVVVGSKFTLFGDGQVQRDFTYIDDAINSLVALLSELESHNNGWHDVVNIGGGNPLSINYLINQISTQLGQKLDYVQSTSNSNDAKKTMADPSYLQSLIGVKPEVKLDTGIAEVIEWCQKSDIKSQLDSWINSVA